MKHTSFITASAFLAAFALSVVPAAAQSRGHAASRGTATRSAVVGRAVPRVGPAPRIVSRGRIGVVPYYRPFYGLGLYGYPFDYYGYGYYGYPHGYGYPYGYGSFGFGYPSYAPPPVGYGAEVAARPYGSVRIESDNPDAQVFADGYYVGIVDDFDGTFQHLNLEAGPHRIEVRTPNAPPISFDVNVQPGQTITYRAGGRR
jgi:hypothetical protein